MPFITTTFQTEDETLNSWVLPVQVSYDEASNAARRGEDVRYYDRSPTGKTLCVRCSFDEEVGTMVEDHPTISGDFLVVLEDPTCPLFIFPKDAT